MEKKIDFKCSYMLNQSIHFLIACTGFFKNSFYYGSRGLRSLMVLLK